MGYSMIYADFVSNGESSWPLLGGLEAPVQALPNRTERSLAKVR